MLSEMKWRYPPVIKIYEALGAVADERIEVSGNSAKVFSSSGSKFYEVQYDPTSGAIMANDNGSYWKGYLGYPSIALLLKLGVLNYHSDLARELKGIPWKDINQKYKNDFSKTLDHILSRLPEETSNKLVLYIAGLEDDIKSLKLSLLGKRITPPEGY